MNASSLAKSYDKLEAAERFALILQARARGDEAEADRLAKTAGWLPFRYRDFTPHAEAFHDLAQAVFMDLMDAAGEFADAQRNIAEHDYEEALDKAYEAKPDADEPDDKADDDDGETETDDGDAGEPETECAGDAGAGRNGKRPLAQRWMHLMLAAGYMVKSRADGWELFCKRRHVPPFLLFELMPGYRRLRSVLDLLNGTPDLPGPAFTAAGMVRFLKDIHREKGRGELTEADIFTAEGIADQLDATFREIVERRGG
jgi:hypothetical protein